MKRTTPSGHLHMVTIERLSFIKNISNYLYRRKLFLDNSPVPRHWYQILFKWLLTGFILRMVFLLLLLGVLHAFHLCKICETVRHLTQLYQNSCYHLKIEKIHRDRKMSINREFIDVWNWSANFPYLYILWNTKCPPV